MPVKPTAYLSRKIHRLIVLQVLILCAFTSLGQTNISGIVNSYYKVIEVIPAKACVRLNTVAGLAHLQKTLLIQMKGASVITTNGATLVIRLRSTMRGIMRSPLSVRSMAILYLCIIIF